MVSGGFHVLDWAAQAEGRSGRAAWRAWAGATAEATGAATPPAQPGLPMMLRRRLTPLGQAAIATAYAIGADAGMHYVFASRHGEFRRNLRLLEALAQQEAPSPADFSLSVHNALAGLLSIATQARAGHTAIAAGPDSFAAGLLEAAALLPERPGGTVLLVYYDDDLPAPFDEVQPGPQAGALALAVLLGGEAGLPGAEAVGFTATPQASAPARPTIAQAEDFLRFLASGAATGRAEGGRMRLAWRRGG